MTDVETIRARLLDVLWLTRDAPSAPDALPIDEKHGKAAKRALADDDRAGRSAFPAAKWAALRGLAELALYDKALAAAQAVEAVAAPVTPTDADKAALDAVQAIRDQVRAMQARAEAQAQAEGKPPLMPLAVALGEVRQVDPDADAALAEAWAAEAEALLRVAMAAQNAALAALAAPAKKRGGDLVQRDARLCAAVRPYMEAGHDGKAARAMAFAADRDLAAEFAGLSDETLRRIVRDGAASI